MSMTATAAKANASQDTRIQGSIDWWMATMVILLTVIGLLMVFSASGAIADRLFDDKYWFFKRQCLYAGIGSAVLLFVAALPRKLLYSLQMPMLAVTVILLILVLTPIGVKVKGAARWISLGIFSIQPMEFAKVALALYLGYFMSAKQAYLKTFRHGMVPPFLVTFLLCCLLILQPDFGGVITLAALLFSMCLVGGIRFIYLSGCLVICVGILVEIAFNSPYRLRRITAFLHPEDDVLGAGYQLIQSFYAFGSGGFWGAGIGESAQKMLYLPEAHTDFIMSVVGEELGFFGISAIMFLFLCFFYRCYRTIIGQEDLRDKLSAFGVCLVLCIGATQNLAVVLGMMPLKGVAMPFMSYGGSCLIASMLCAGLLLNFSRTSRN